MPEFVISILMALAGISAVVGIVFNRNITRNPRVWTIIGGCLGVVLAGGLFAQSLFQSVPTKSVGVVTSYGRVIGSPYGPGGHWIAPWRTLNPISDTIQSDNFSQANCPLVNGSPQPCDDVQLPSGTRGYCIIVRFAGLNQGCVDVQLQTQVEPPAIPELYANYSSYGPNLALDVDQFVVQRELRTELNRVLGDYNVIQDELASLQACTAATQQACSAITTSQFSQFDPQILRTLQADPQLAGKVDVLDVNLQFPHFTGNVENAIESIQQSYTETVKATQQEKTNAAISLANAALVNPKTGQALTPAILTYDCLQVIQDAIKAGYQLPVGFNCNGSSSNLILPGGKG